MRQALLVCVCLSVLLGACGLGAGGPTAIAEPTVGSPTASPEVPQTSYPEPLEIISAENIGQLELLEMWGEGVVYDVVASPDEKLVAALAETGIYIFDSETLELEDFINDANDSSHTHSEALAYSDDGKLLAYSDGLFVTIIDIQTKEIKGTVRTRQPVWGIVQLEFLPGTDSIVIISFDVGVCDDLGTSISIHDFQDVVLFTQSACLHEYPHKFQILSDGDVFVFAENAVYILRTSEGFQIQTVRETDVALNHENNGGGFYGVSPDGSTLAYMDYGGGQKATLLYDIDSGEVIETLPGVEEYFGQNPRLERMTFHASDNRDLEEEVERVCPRVSNDGPDFSSVISWNGEIAVIGIHNIGPDYSQIHESIRAIEVWDIATCELLHERRFVFAINGKTSPDGQYLATTNGFDTHLWRLSGDGSADFVFPGQADYGPMNLFSFNSDGTLIATGSSLRESSNPDPVSLTHIMSIWDVETGALIREIHQSRVRLTEFYPGPLPSIFLTDDTERGVSTYDAESGLMLKRNFRTPFVYDAIRQGFWVVSDSSQVTYIVLQGFPDGQTKRAFRSPLDRVDSIDIDSSGRYLIVAGMGRLGYFGVIDIYTTKILYFKDRVPPIFVLGRFTSEANAFSPLGSGGFMDLWRFDGWNGATLFSGTFSPSGAIVVSFDGYRLAFWDSSVGMEILPRVDISDFAVFGPEIMFTPDGRLLIVIGNDGLIRLYGVRDESP